MLKNIYKSIRYNGEGIIFLRLLQMSVMITL